MGRLGRGRKRRGEGEKEGRMPGLKKDMIRKKRRYTKTELEVHMVGCSKIIMTQRSNLE